MGQSVAVHHSARDIRYEISIHGDDERVFADARELCCRIYLSEGLSAGSVALRAPSYGTDRTIAVVAYDDTAGDALPVGAVQLVRATTDLHSVPMSARYDLSSIFDTYPPTSIAEVSGYCVDERYRRTNIARELAGEILRVSRELGVDIWVMAAEAGTDDLLDARIAWRLAKSMELSNERLVAYPLSTGNGPNEPSKTLYDPEERARALAGDFGKLKLPRKTRLYAAMGARFVGEPAWEPAYNTCSLPMVLLVVPEA